MRLKFYVAFLINYKLLTLCIFKICLTDFDFCNLVVNVFQIECMHHHFKLKALFNLLSQFSS